MAGDFAAAQQAYVELLAQLALPASANGNPD
jgi:hypothetical protein